MRQSVRKRYEEIGTFVQLANLGWDELYRHNDFPTLNKLDPHRQHRALLKRIDRTVERRFKAVRIPDDVPLLIVPNWNLHGRPLWRQLHAYALVRRIIDSLLFFNGIDRIRRQGSSAMQLSLQAKLAEDGSKVRVHDPYEDFLVALRNCDLRRLRQCPMCRRFFVAWRKDQKACKRSCANRARVGKFRKKQADYLENRRFRKRTGLEAVRHGRKQLLELHDAIAAADRGKPQPKIHGC